MVEICEPLVFGRHRGRAAVSGHSQGCQRVENKQQFTGMRRTIGIASAQGLRDIGEEILEYRRTALGVSGDALGAQQPALIAVCAQHQQEIGFLACRECIDDRRGFDDAIDKWPRRTGPWSRVM